MLVRKNVLNEINKEGTFTQGFNDCRKIKRKVSQNLDDLVQVTNQMMHRYERSIHHYIQYVQKTSSKQIQRKIDEAF